MEKETINRQHEKGILEAIEKYPIFKFKDIFVYYKACCRATAYSHGLDKLDSIKEALYSNCRREVSTMLVKWMNSKNATLEIAAFKIIADEDERRAINQNYNDITTKGESINIPISKWAKDDTSDTDTEI